MRIEGGGKKKKPQEIAPRRSGCNVIVGGTARSLLWLRRSSFNRWRDARLHLIDYHKKKKKPLPPQQTSVKPWSHCVQATTLTTPLMVQVHAQLLACWKIKLGVDDEIKQEKSPPYQAYQVHVVCLDSVSLELHCYLQWEPSASIHTTQNWETKENENNTDVRKSSPSSAEIELCDMFSTVYIYYHQRLKANLNSCQIDWEMSSKNVKGTQQFSKLI